MTELASPAEVELLRIVDEIVAMALSEDEWALRESADMFQSDHLSGGYDATEGAFLFSYFPDAGGEWWFDLGLEAVQEAAASRVVAGLRLRPAS